MLSLFGFGKRRRKTARKSKKTHKKPPARLLKICKKYHIKTTKKVGGKRVYKPTKVLARMCLKKAMKKEKAKSKARKMKKPVRKTRRVHRRSEFGEMHMPFMQQKPSFGAMTTPKCGDAYSFGKRRSGRKVSKASAMKAFRSFYKRHCAGMRKSRFGSGGNPPLGMSMGYEFCPSGMGGVLGAGSTGLFPSPCTSMNAAQANIESSLSLPTYSSSMPEMAATAGMASSSDLGSYSNAFGRRRRVRRTTMVGARKSAAGARRRKSTKKRSTTVGAKRRTTTVGAKRRTTTVGVKRRAIRRQ